MTDQAPATFERRQWPGAGETRAPLRRHVSDVAPRAEDAPDSARTAPPAKRPAGTLSIRVVWPFTRLMPDYEAEAEILRSVGLDVKILGDANARLPHAVAARLLEASVAKMNDPALGLHAGERVESGDFGVLEYVARSCPDFRTALECCARYMGLLDDGLDASIVEEGDRAAWRIRWTHGPRSPAMNDFAMAASWTIGKRLLGVDAPGLGVRFEHATATDEEEYRRVFRMPVALGAGENALIYPRAALDANVCSANRQLCEAFKAEAEELLGKITGTKSVTARVRQYVLEHLTHGDVGMLDVAHHFHMSTATLRRRLADEGTTHRDIVNDVRRELALRHLANKSLAVSEVAFLLGFSSVGALSRAFKRWTGRSPLDYRR